ncbi:MAG TPA: NAD-dependent epimerase/dehydratase family protein [Acidimicrobiales bacterium]|nr:NAD-dependent epimerase/dehydratase family protein [Acidimicrobiales bacterium]
MFALVTGGAGFIGSNLVDALLAAGWSVRVLDDLSTGRSSDVPEAAEMLTGDVSDADAVRKAVDGVDVVFHQAALRAVLRSVEDPLSTDHVNTHGTLTVLKSAADAGVRRVIYASSSSVYGGSSTLPTPESAPLMPRSPYAVSKLSGEHYCRVFWELTGLETVALRYFNVYGPRQRPDSQYAAVIPLFIDALRRGQPPMVHGDGRQTRDFTFITDVVACNILAATAPASACAGKAYNVAGGKPWSLLELIELLAEAMGVDPPVARHGPPRAGDVRHTAADVAAAISDLGHRAKVPFPEGLRRTVEWFIGAGPNGR